MDNFIPVDENMSEATIMKYDALNWYTFCDIFESTFSNISFIDLFVKTEEFVEYFQKFPEENEDCPYFQSIKRSLQQLTNISIDMHDQSPVKPAEIPAKLQLYIPDLRNIVSLQINVVFDFPPNDYSSDDYIYNLEVLENLKHFTIYGGMLECIHIKTNKLISVNIMACEQKFYDSYAQSFNEFFADTPNLEILTLDYIPNGFDAKISNSLYSFSVKWNDMNVDPIRTFLKNHRNSLTNFYMSMHSSIIQKLFHNLSDKQISLPYVNVISFQLSDFMYSTHFERSSLGITKAIVPAIRRFNVSVGNYKNLDETLSFCFCEGVNEVIFMSDDTPDGARTFIFDENFEKRLSEINSQLAGRCVFRYLNVAISKGTLIKIN